MSCYNLNLSYSWILGEDTFSILFDFKGGDYQFFKIFHKKMKNSKKPAIGVEPMTIALQMRCSNL